MLSGGSERTKPTNTPTSQITCIRFSKTWQFSLSPQAIGLEISQLGRWRTTDLIEISTQNRSNKGGLKVPCQFTDLSSPICGTAPLQMVNCEGKSVEIRDDCLLDF